VRSPWAITEFREAIRIKKDSAEAHCNLGIALHDKGRLDEAIAEFRGALQIKKDLPEAHNGLGNALRARGRLDEAIAEYREALRIQKDYPEAHYNLGIALQAKGRLEEAIASYKEAVRLKKDFPLAHYSLGNALQAKGRLDEAIAAFREAIRIQKDYAEAYCNLGTAFERKGQFAEALVYRRRGHELGSKDPRWPYPSAQWVRNCERLVELDGKLRAILGGRKQPADPAERLALAGLCQMPCKQQYAAAVRFYDEAFAAEPKLAADLRAGHRYNAACAAALAAAGRGKDARKLDAPARARLRRQALDWLRADLRQWAGHLEKGSPQLRLILGRTLEHWLLDSDLAGVRGERALAGLAAEERRGWRQLWAEVETTLAKARQEHGRKGKPAAKP
jgi:eukaryotic-like serine/threonine-protein kinase